MVVLGPIRPPEIEQESHANMRKCWYCGSGVRKNPCPRCGGPWHFSKKAQPETTVVVRHVERPGRSASAYLDLVAHIRRGLRA